MKLSTLSLYYRLKPFIPRWLQVDLRRLRAWVLLAKNKDKWPIDEKAAMPPKDWRGWPDRKKFAFILTHDIDTLKGQERCRKLMHLEQELGFTGSYNFVPERYKVSEELRNDLTENGFEVGVHGLTHDGLYFSSKKIFEERAERINRYLKEWESVGFRMPSMLHNLSWLHKLEILYDSSTFDTDPFEPQSDGVGTIFPYWVHSGNGRPGYVEIPYTMPQDFTLYVLLRQKNIDTWKRKLDWIAKKGGMALLLVHPDYINLGIGQKGNEEYPLAYYRDFLQYLRSEYRGEYYNVLPRDLAKFWQENYRNSR